MVVLFVALLGWALGRTPEGSIRPIQAAALASGPSSERWMGIFYEDQAVGYAVSSEVATEDGGLLIQDRSVFRMVDMGEIKSVVTAGTALLDRERRLLRFDVLWDGDPVHLVARGEVREKELALEVHQGGDIQTLSLPFDEPPQINLSWNALVEKQTLSVGKHFSFPYFDPITLSQSNMDVAVTGVEVLPTGEEAYWLSTTFSGMETRRLVTPAGDMIREEGGLGLSLVRMSRDEAEKLFAEGKPVDFIGLAAIHPAGTIPDSRGTRTLVLSVSGVDPEKIANEPPVQTRDGSTVKIQVPLEMEIGEAPIATAAASPGLAPFLRAEPFLPSDHPQMREQARKVVGDAANLRDASRRLNAWVFANVQKRPIVGIPNGLEVLHTREGDCNEHTALYVSLARAAGVPARIAAGVVYSDRIEEQGAFYYHAWPEVWLGQAVGWVPVDPTFGEFPADATHLKLVEGNLDRQVEIMGFMGRLALKIVEAR